MPVLPARPCSMPGCPRRAVQRGRCELHQRLSRQPDQRGSATERGYGYHWQQVSAAYLRRSPECVVCGAQATDVDHIVPRSRGGTDDEDNLQALCHSCHSRKTRRVDR